MTRGVLFIGVTTILITAAIIAGGLYLLGDDGDVDAGSGEDVALGFSTYKALCSGCHSTDGSIRIGPSFEGLYGNKVTMEDGTTLVVDEDHLRESITEPQARVREGFPNVMPPFDDLDDDEVDRLIAYIQSLE